MRSEFMGGINECRPQHTNYVIFVRGNNFGFMHQASVEYVIGAIYQSGIPIEYTTNDTPTSRIQQTRDHIHQIHRANRCTYCLKSTLSGSICCPTCQKPCCNQCWVDNACPTCNIIKVNSIDLLTSPDKSTSRFCSGIPSCPVKKLKKKCGWCRQIFYCSTKCMDSHWSEHRKKECFPLSENLAKTTNVI